MSNKVLLYPFSRESFPLTQYVEYFQPQLLLEDVVSPYGLGLVGKPIGTVCNRETDKEYIIGDNVSAKLDQNDILLITQTDNAAVIKETLDHILHALSMGKKVICLRKLNKIEKETIYKSNFINNFYYYCETTDALSIENDTSVDRYYPTVPVVFIGGLVETGDTFEILLKLTRELRSSGCKVLSVANKQYASFLNINPIPTFIYQAKIDDKDKISYFRNYIKTACQIYHPDIILIEIPDAMMKYNDDLSNGYGINTYLFSNAIHPDFTLCSVPFELCQSEFLDMISTNFEYKFGFSIDAVIISNILIDSSESSLRHRLCTVFVNDEMIQNYCNCNNDNSIPIYSFKQFIHVCDLPIAIKNNGVKTKNKVYNRNIIQHRIFDILCCKFRIKDDLINNEYTKTPLTNMPFSFSAISLAYLFFEIEKVFEIRIPERYLHNYAFNKIENIIDMLCDLLC